MVARHVRILVGYLFSTILLLSSLVAPVAAAAECVLLAPATVNVGTPLTVQGTGFPASSSVEIKLTVQGGSSDAFVVQSSATGELQINLTPEAADVGQTTVAATAGSTCTAQVIYTVLGVGETAPPPAEPDASAAGAEAGPKAPGTDTSGIDGETAYVPGGVWFLALLILAIGLWGLIAGRSTRSR